MTSLESAGTGKKNKLTFGLIGTGYWGKILESKLLNFGELKWKSSGRDPKDYKYKLNSVDWVFVATPTATHARFTEEALDAGTNVFCEKPFTVNHGLSSRLYKLADKRGAKLYVDDVFLWGDQLMVLERHIRERGLPRKLDFVWKKKDSMEDVFCSLGYHDLTILDKILGGIQTFEVEKVSANGKGPKFIVTRVNGIEVRLAYHLDYEGKSKQIIADGEIVYDHATQKNDALMDMIDGLLNGKADLRENRERTLRIERILEDLTRKYGNETN